MNTIFSPLLLGQHMLRNRICVPPMVVSQTDEGGCVRDADVEHYRALAAGGAGLIIQEATAVSVTGKLAECQLGVWADGHVPGLKRIADAVHAEGGKIIMQIHHAGILSTRVPDAPAAIHYQDAWRDVTGIPLTEARAAEIHEQFVQAGRRAWEAGYDGVELHGAHSYLISELLNPTVNTRDDSLGRDPAAWVRSIILEIRACAGPDFLVGIRIGGREPTLEDGKRNILSLKDAVDFFDVSSGYGSGDHPVRMDAPEGWAHGALTYAAREAKRWLREAGCEKPVFAVGGIISPEEAEAVLRDTGADLADIGRGHLINPNWSRDAIAGLDTGKCFHCKVCRFKEGLCPGVKRLERSRA